MTQKTQLEIIQKSFPDVGETEARERLNVAKADFVRETRIIQGVGEEDTVSGQLLYPFSDFTISGGGTVIEVRDVAVEDVLDADLMWYIHDDNEQLIIGQENPTNSNKLQAFSTAGKTIEVTGVFSDPDYGTDLTVEPGFDTEFHMGMVYKVLADLHLERPDGVMGKRDRFIEEYKNIEIRAKKTAGSRGLKGNYRTFTSAGQD